MTDVQYMKKPTHKYKDDQKIMFAVQRFKIQRCFLKGCWVVTIDWVLLEDP